MVAFWIFYSILALNDYEVTSQKKKALSKNPGSSSEQFWFLQICPVD